MVKSEEGTKIIVSRERQNIPDTVRPCTISSISCVNVEGTLDTHPYMYPKPSILYTVSLFVFDTKFITLCVNEGEVQRKRKGTPTGRRSDNFSPSSGIRYRFGVSYLTTRTPYLPKLGWT